MKLHIYQPHGGRRVVWTVDARHGIERTTVRASRWQLLLALFTGKLNLLQVANHVRTVDHKTRYAWFGESA